MSNFIRVFESIQKTGGASFCLSTGELNPSTGYMVSEKGFERKYPIPPTFNKFQDIVLAYLLVVNNGKLYLGDYVYLGFWINDGSLYIDVSHKFTSKETALVYGRLNNQLAIFDNANKKSIFFTKDKDMVLLARFSKGLLISMLGYVTIVATVLAWYFFIHK